MNDRFLDSLIERLAEGKEMIVVYDIRVDLICILTPIENGGCLLSYEYSYWRFDCSPLRLERYEYIGEL